MVNFEDVVLRSHRVTLRNLIEDDLPALFDIFSHPEVMRYWSAPPMADVGEAERLLRDIQSGYADGSFLQLGIERNQDHLLMGTCTLFSFHTVSRRAEIGYALGRSHWGKGFMHEALRLLVDYAFGTLDLNRLEADIDPRNSASRKTLERLGFIKEGHLRQRWIVNGEISDTDFYGLLHKDWMASTIRS